jgi:Chaperone of endosialidase
MGGTSTSTQSQTSQTNPYAPASGALSGILGGINSLVPGAGSLTGAQTGAINTLTANGQAGDPNAAASTAGVAGLLNGGGATANNANINSAYQQYQGLLNSTANGSNIGANSALIPQLNQIATDTTNDINSQFAAAGRDGSPANTQALARGIAAGEAPVLASQYNTDVTNQLGAAGSLYNAANTTYGLLNNANSTANANIQAGIGADPAAYAATNAGANQTLQAQANLFGIPVSQLTTLLGAVSPVAQAFGTQNGSSSGTQTASGAQQFGELAGGVGGLLKYLPSDRRLKQDISRVGALCDGTPVYRFRYIGSPVTHTGLMADDVEKTTPEAVVTVGGFKMVDYDAATHRAREIAEVG